MKKRQILSLQDILNIEAIKNKKKVIELKKCKHEATFNVVETRQEEIDKKASKNSIKNFVNKNSDWRIMKYEDMDDEQKNVIDHMYEKDKSLPRCDSLCEPQ